MSALRQRAESTTPPQESGDDRFSGWKARLQKLIDRHAGYRMDGKVASERTIEATATVLFEVFNTLHGLGMKLEHPENIGEKHIVKLVTYWYAKGSSIRTMQSKMSTLRKFAMWIGKKGMIRSLAAYLRNVPATRLKVTATASEPKSWTLNGISVDRKIAEAEEIDERFGLMLRIARAFGLRRKELIMFRPWKADCGDYIQVFSNAGPKGGRARTVQVTSEEQRQALDHVKSRIPKTGALGWTHTRRGRPATLRYQLKEYNRRMEQIGITRAIAGVTGHGLRSEFSEVVGLEQGVIPPTMGGTADQMPKEDLDLARARVSEALGHSRLSITNSYYGSFGRQRKRAEKHAGVPENFASGKATSAPPRQKVSESGSRSEAKHAGVQGFRGRKQQDVDARQIDLQLNDGILMFRKKPR